MTTQHTETTAHQQTQPHNMANDSQPIKEKDESSYKKITITLQSDHGPRTVTWEMAKPDSTDDLEVDRRLDFHDALQTAINDFASALQHAYAISGRGDCTTTAHQRNTYWLPQEPTDTHIVSGYNIPRDVKVHVPERCGYYCVELVFSQNAEVAEMLKAKPKSLDAGEPLYYSKEELCCLSDLHFSRGSIWRPYDMNRGGSHHIRLTFPGTREALDAILPRIQAAVDGETLEFTVRDLAHVSFVEHNKLDGSPVLAKTFYRDFDMQQPKYEYDEYNSSTESLNYGYSREEHDAPISWSDRHYWNKADMEQDAVYFSLKFGHLQQQQSKELVDNYLWLEQERIIHTHSSSQRTVRPSIVQGGSVFLRPVESYLEAATEEHDSSNSEEWSNALDIQPTSAPSQKDDGGQALADSEDTAVKNLTAKSLKLQEALLAIDQQIAKLQVGSSAERSGGIADVQKELDRLPNV